MNAYEKRLAIIMKKGDAILADLTSSLKKMKSIKDKAFPEKKTLTKEDIENCPPLKRENARYQKKFDEFANNTSDLINLSKELNNEE